MLGSRRCKLLHFFCFFCYIRSNTLLTSVFLPDNLIGSFVGNPVESGIFVNPHKITDFIQKSHCSATFLYKNSQKRIFNENIFSNFLKILCFCIFLQHFPVFDTKRSLDRLFFLVFRKTKAPVEQAVRNKK